MSKKDAAARVLLELNPIGVVDRFGGDDVDVIERGERRWFTPAEADALLAIMYGGRAVFTLVEEPQS